MISSHALQQRSVNVSEGHSHSTRLKHTEISRNPHAAQWMDFIDFRRSPDSFYSTSIRWPCGSAWNKGWVDYNKIHVFLRMDYIWSFNLSATAPLTLSSTLCLLLLNINIPTCQSRQLPWVILHFLIVCMFSLLQWTRCHVNISISVAWRGLTLQCKRPREVESRNAQHAVWM